MNKIILISIFLVGKAVFACQPEAQVIGQVTQVQKDEISNVCFVDVSFNSLNGYTPSGVCPLDENIVHQQGIIVKMFKNYKCQYNQGDELSGYLIQTQDGNVYLDQ